MTSFKDHRVLPYTPDQLFDLVIDIESYPLFLPWCKGARIVDRQDDHIVADLTVGFSVFEEKFTSHVFFDRPKSIRTSYVKGALTHLNSVWQFADNGHCGTELNFDVQFDVQSFVAGLLMKSVFEQAAFRMIKAFENRAAMLYTENSIPGKKTQS